MMAKRKRVSSILNRTRKRAKDTVAEPHPHGAQVAEDPDREYKLKSIVGEDRTRYLISWEDDEVTGEVFEDTWEPKRNANRQAIEDWEKQKAEKKRLERLTGRLSSTSRSNSASDSSLPVSSPKPRKPSRQKGRPRKVIESSSQVEAVSQTNGNRDEHPGEDFPEIGESPEASPQQETNAGSPLFEPLEAALNDQPPLVVRPSPPPSSYLAGGYQVPSSSPPVSSAPVQTKQSPEPSQYLPDPGDTSKTTEDTTEISLAASSPPKQTQSIPVNFDGASSNEFVPDSQSGHPSSSFLPSTAEAVSSSSASEARRGVSSSEGHLPSSVRNDVPRSTSPEHSSQAQQNSSTNGHIHPEVHSPVQGESAAVLNQPHLAAVAEQNVASSESSTSQHQGAQSHVNNQTDEESDKDRDKDSIKQNSPNRSQSKGVEDTDRVQAGTSASRANQEPSELSDRIESIRQGNNTFDGNHAESPSAASPGTGESDPDRSSTHESSVPAAAEVTEPPSATSLGNPPIPQPQPFERGHNQAEITSALAEPEAATSPVDIVSTSTPDTQLNREAHPKDPNKESGALYQTDLQNFQQRLPAITPEVASEKSNRVENSAYIDLTDSQNQVASNSSTFNITQTDRQPVRFGFARRRSSPKGLASSAWQSSFPFQTQLSGSLSTYAPQSNSVSPVRPDFASPRTDTQRPPLSQSGSPRRDVPLFSPGASQLPQSRASPASSSSSIPQPPSKLVGTNTFGESAPPPPVALSSPFRPSGTMDPTKTSSPASSLAEKLHAMRQASKDEKAARAARRGETPSSAVQTPKNTSPTSLPQPTPSSVGQPAAPKLASPLLLVNERKARSPSAVPAILPLPIITQEEMNTSRRCETLLPQSLEGVAEEVQQSDSLANNGTSDPVRADKDLETANVHVVPIYFVGHQRDQYPNLVYHYRDLVQRFLATKGPDAQLTSEVEQFLNRVRHVTMHPDLDNTQTAFTQYDVNPSQQATWDVSCSAKFRFLKELLNLLRDSKLRIAILAQSGRIIDILETFLKGIEVAYYRPGVAGSTSASEGRGDLKVYVSATGSETTTSSPVDLVLAMDNSVKHTSDQIKALRHRDGKWSPLMTLVVPRSVEHIERCLSGSLSDRAWTRALVSGIQQFRKEAGRTQDGPEIPKDTARILALYLTTTDESFEWPLPALATLEDLDSQTDSEADVTVSNADTSKLAIVGEKRSREDDEGTNVGDSSKRSRVESPVAGLEDDATINPQELDITHISDSIGKATQSNNADIDAEASSPTLNSTEQRLQDMMRERQDRLDEHLRVLGDLQYRHEEQRTKLLEVTRERDDAIATAQKAVVRLTEDSNKMSNLRSEVTTLREQLKEANAKLLDHSVPERAEFETLRLELAQAKAKEEKAERRIEQANKDAAYVRSLYQDSSNAAQTSAAQVSELENDLAVAQNKATGEQARLRQMGYDTFTRNLQDENKKLKTMLKEREAGLKFRDEEIAKLKEASRGRMGTRGTSVPRSPRMGSPRVPSRQTSPAAGDLRGRAGLLHPLRNAES